MITSRQFEGRIFVLYGTSTNRVVANIKAGQIRADGHQARIIAKGETFGIYWNPKPPNRNGRSTEVI